MYFIKDIDNPLLNIVQELENVIDDFYTNLYIRGGSPSLILMHPKIWLKLVKELKSYHSIINPEETGYGLKFHYKGFSTYRTYDIEENAIIIK